jgi:glutathione peroxidase
MKNNKFGNNLFLLLLSHKLFEMKLLLFPIWCLCLISCTTPEKKQNNTEMSTLQSSDSLPTIHTIQVESLQGGTINLADFKGKKILIVNTASECGYTPQYKALQSLYASHKDKLVVLGVPSNDFGGQEPGSNAEIGSFCEKNYGVTFPLASKSIVTGDQMCPLYQWLTQKTKNGVLDATIGWNFNKFLLDENGHLIQKFESKVAPEDPEILNAL